MKKFLKWLLASPVLFLGLYIIGLCSSEFRTLLTMSITKTLNITIREIERSL